MTLHDEKLGPCEVYVVVDMEYGIDSFVHSGYVVSDFRELTDEECEALTEKFREDILIYTQERMRLREELNDD